MDVLQQQLFDQSVLSLREVLRLVLLSGLFTVACFTAFRRNASTRRLLLLAAVISLTVLPWVLAGVDAIWFVATENPPAITLSAMVPNGLLWGWLGVAGVLVVQHLLMVKREVRDLARLPHIRDICVGRELTDLASVLQIPVPEIRLGTCACSTTLCTPMLILPENWARWDKSTLKSVLAHELIHIQRRDDRWLLLTRVLVLSYWWMPWLIWLYRVYVRSMEESCDDAASEMVGHHLAYVGALVDAARAQPQAATNRYTSVANMQEHDLVGRIGRFAELRVLELDSSGVYWWVIGILLFVAALSGVEPVLARHGVDEPSVTLLPPVATPDQQPAIFPLVHERTELPRLINGALRNRLRHAEHARRAVYPGVAIRNGIEGHVLVEFYVSADGSVTNAVVVGSHPAKVFVPSALRAVRHTRYSPAHTVPVHFAPAQTIRRADLGYPLKPPGEPIRVRRYFRFRLERR